MITAGQLLRRVLMARGIGAVYGEPQLASVALASPDVARLLAAAHTRVLGVQAATWDGARLTVGEPREEVRVTEPAGLVDAVGAGVAVRVEFDLDAPAPDVVPVHRPDDEPATLDAAIRDALETAARPLMLVGPGVVAADAVPALHAVAAAGSIGVLNTWGAKGVFDWRSRHHLATIGLQAGDFELGGLGDADLIIASGLDPLEAPPARWRLGPAVEVPPPQLAECVVRADRPIQMPPLRAALAEVTQSGWAQASAPLMPSRVTLHYAQAGIDLVAADPGLAGFWVARTYATRRLGAVHVPAAGRSVGMAAACATVSRLWRPLRPVLAVVDAPLDPASAAVLDAAAGLGVAVPMEIWDPDGRAMDADAHGERLARLVLDPDPAPVTLATDPSQLARIEAVAGPVIAWTG